jgi:hypothetical protein
MSRRLAALSKHTEPELPITGELVPFEPAALEARVKTLGEEFATRIVALVQTANVTVTDVPSCEAAQGLRETVDQLDKEAEKFFNAPDGEKKLYHSLHALACTREREVRMPLAQLEAKLRSAVKTFNDEQTRQRQAEERRLADEQRKRDQERAAAEAAALETSGDSAMAMAVIEESIAAPMPSVVLPTLKALIPTTVKWLWRFRPGVTAEQAIAGAGMSPLDLLRLVLPYVPDGSIAKKKIEQGIALEQARVPRAFLALDTVRVNRYVANMKDAAKGMLGTGIEVFSDEVPR